MVMPSQPICDITHDVLHRSFVCKSRHKLCNLAQVRVEQPNRPSTACVHESGAGTNRSRR